MLLGLYSVAMDLWILQNYAAMKLYMISFSKALRNGLQADANLCPVIMSLHSHKISHDVDKRKRREVLSTEMCAIN